MAAIPTTVPALPSFATASLEAFDHFIETFAHHRLPAAYIAFVLLYASLHAIFFVLCMPIFADQLKSGRFWLVRLVATKRGRIIVPNYIDAGATLIGAYTLYDIGYCIKLVTCYYQKSDQHNLPALLCMRFIILTTIGWIFLLGFVLVKVPPTSFTIPPMVWNLGIFAIPLSIHFGALALLIKATNHWNAYWSDYIELQGLINSALARGDTVPSPTMVEIARDMLGVELAQYSKLVLYWCAVYMVWTALFATAIFVVTLSIVLSHWQELRVKEELPMQNHVQTMPSARNTARSLTASAGIRRWIKAVPAAVPGEDLYQKSLTSGSTLDGAAEGTKPGTDGSQASLDPKKRDHHLPMSKLILYGLGLRPLTKDAYNDPSGGFSERRARAGLRSLLRHTAIQGSAIFVIGLAHIAAGLIMVHPSFLQPLRTGAVAGWSVKWVELTSILRLLEFYGAAMPGFVLIGSILRRQIKARQMSRARAREGIVVDGSLQTERTGHNFQLSAPGPSASAAWSLQQKTARIPSPMLEEDEAEYEQDKGHSHDDDIIGNTDDEAPPFGSSDATFGVSPLLYTARPPRIANAALPQQLAPAEASRTASTLLQPHSWRTGARNMEDDSVVADGASSAR